MNVPQGPIRVALVGILAAGCLAVPVRAEFPVVTGVERQPLLAQVRRLAEALDALGQPLSPDTTNALAAATRVAGDAPAVEAVQAVLDPLCGLYLHARVDGSFGHATADAPLGLVEQGWRAVLIKVFNEAGTTGALRISSPNAGPLPGTPAADLTNRWLEVESFARRPLHTNLSGLRLEYRVMQVWAARAGRTGARLDFVLDRPATASIGVPLSFEVAPAHPVRFDVRDELGRPAMATFVIRDEQGRVHPLMSKRLAPDFFFHPQIYRADGEVLSLPAGTYTVTCSRGPESLPEIQSVRVNGPAVLRYQVRRWIDPAARGWYSGDHHIHAAGCLHYSRPSEGVLPRDMQRHIMGEDLKIGANLTWGPGFDYQKDFFCGREDAVSQYPYLLRYDVEVSGFGSHQSGHLCLLRLREQIPPGGVSKLHWPTLGLNTLRWAKAQGAICGPAHSALGLAGVVSRIEGPDGPGGLPDYAVPAYDGIGANEYVVDVTHNVPGPDGRLVPAVDFISTMNTDRRREWNMWYHTLNCGFRVKASGETDFPCITGERVGLGRVYVKQAGRLNYDDWCEGIRAGRSYVSDGTAHLMEFTAVVPGSRPVAVGEGDGEIALTGPGMAEFRVIAAVRQPGSNHVPVELIVNGYPVDRVQIPADGREQKVVLTTRLERSSWVAWRIGHSAHSNPFFVIVAGRPVRPSRRSAEWMLRGVEQCWREKERTYAEAELPAARAAYDHARDVYRRLVTDAFDDTP